MTKTSTRKFTMQHVLYRVHSKLVGSNAACMLFHSLYILLHTVKVIDQ